MAGRLDGGIWRAVSIVFFLLWGCGGAETGSISDTTPPAVSFTSPARASTGVAVNTAISVAFSEPMDVSTIDQAGITLTDPSSNVAGTVNFSGTMATFTPSTRLAYDTTYTVTIVARVKDVAGNALTADYSWSFTTGPALDTTRPTVSVTSPAHNTTGMAVNKALSAAFSEPVDPVTLTTSTFILTGPAGAVTGTVNANGTTATFTPLAALAYQTAYTATLTMGVKDLAGNPLVADYVWSFTTGPAPDTTAPSVTLTTPSHNATGLSINSAIGVAFSEAMDPGTLTTATLILTGPAGAVAGTVNANGTTATFTPLAALAYQTAYTATLTMGVKDLAGNPLVADYVWSFTTGPAPDTTAPTVSFTLPPNNATGIPIDSVVGVVFSEAMDLSTLTTATFTLVGPAGAVSGTVISSGATAAFTPLVFLAYNTTYTATVTTARDLAGNAIAESYTWSFTTRTVPDTVLGSPVLIETNAGVASDPQVAADRSGNTIAVWSQYDGTNYNVYANRDEVGMGWGTATLIEALAGNGINPQNPHIVVNKSGSAVAWWYQWDGSVFNVWANYYQAGLGWGIATLIEESDDRSLDVRMVMDDLGNVTAVWGQSNGNYANRYGVGTGWGAPVLIGSRLDYNELQIAGDGGGSVMVAWQQDDGIYANRYTVGVGWGTAISIGNAPSTSTGLQLAVDGSGRAIAVWVLHDGVYANRYDAGTGWSTPAVIWNGVAFSRLRLVMNAAGHAIVMWTQAGVMKLGGFVGFFNIEAIWANQYMAGVGWSTATMIGGSNAFPEIAMDNRGHAIAVWTQLGGRYTSLLASHYESGVGWGVATPVEVSVDRISDFKIAVDGHGGAIVVWRQRDGVHESLWASRFMVGADWGSGLNIGSNGPLVTGRGWESAGLVEGNPGLATALQLVGAGSGDAVAVWRQTDGTYDSIWANRFTLTPLYHIDWPGWPGTPGDPHPPISAVP